MVAIPSPEQLSTAAARGFALGVALPGIAQVIAQRPAWALFWIPAVIAAWILDWRLALALHAGSGLHMVILMRSAVAAVRAGLASTSPGIPAQTS